MRKKKKNNLGLIFVIILLAIIGVAAVGYFFPAVNPFVSPVYAYINEKNKQLPIVYDSEIRWESVTADSGKIQFNYAYISRSNENINIPIEREKQRPVMLNSIRTSSDLKPFRDKKYSFICDFHDKNRQESFTIKFDYDDYK